MNITSESQEHAQDPQQFLLQQYEEGFESLSDAEMNAGMAAKMGVSKDKNGDGEYRVKVTMPDVQIKTQRTPNPNAWKYILGQDVKAEGKVSYTDPAECQHVPLAATLLSLANVTQVHFFENVITVTQNGASNWSVLDQAIQSIIKEKLPAHDIAFATKAEKRPSFVKTAATPAIAQIDEILDRTVRPGLQADGGDLEVLELEGNILTIRYEGACGGCPSAMMGTLEAIKGILRHEFNPELEVVAI